MKKWLAFLMAVCMVFSFAACSNTNEPAEESSNVAANENEPSSNNSATADSSTLDEEQSTSESENETGKILIAYFSYGENANLPDGDLFSIRTVKTYSDNYNTVVDEGQAEKNNNEKPEISSHIDNLDDYDTVFIGFPNWWYGMPMVMYSFLDEYDFSGKTIIPFCTSGGSAFSDAIDEIKTAEPNATVLEGLHISGSSASGAESEVTEWVNGLSLAK